MIDLDAYVLVATEVPSGKFSPALLLPLSPPPPLVLLLYCGIDSLAFWGLLTSILHILLLARSIS